MACLNMIIPLKYKKFNMQEKKSQWPKVQQNSLIVMFLLIFLLFLKSLMAFYLEFLFRNNYFAVVKS